MSSQTTKRQMDLKNVLLSKRSQTYKAFLMYNSNYLTSWKGKTIARVKRSVVARVMGES